MNKIPCSRVRVHVSFLLRSVRRAVLASAVAAAAASVDAISVRASSQSPQLPDAVTQTLDASHPGWTLVAVDPASAERCGGGLRDGMTPSLIWADFNGDNVRDYAAVLDTGGTRSVVLILSRGTTYTSVVLPSRGGLLSVMRRGSRYFDHGRDRSGVARLDTVVVVQCENSAIAYLHEDGRFIEVFISD
jgi:hypothetical protein